MSVSSTDALQRLDDVLIAKAPSLHANLNAPAGKAEFANFIADGFESEVMFINAAGEFDYDEAGYQALEAKHLKSATRP